MLHNISHDIFLEWHFTTPALYFIKTSSHLSVSGHIWWQGCWVLIHEQSVSPLAWEQWTLLVLWSMRDDEWPRAELPEDLRCQKGALMKNLPDVWGWGKHTLPSAAAAAEHWHPVFGWAGSSGWRPAGSEQYCLCCHPFHRHLYAEKVCVFSSVSWQASSELSHLWRVNSSAASCFARWWFLLLFRWSGHDWWKPRDRRWPGSAQRPPPLHSAPGRKAHHSSGFHPATLVPSHWGKNKKNANMKRGRVR